MANVKSEANFSVQLQVGGQIYDFTKFTGGERNRERTKYPRGDRNSHGSIQGMTAIEDITISAPYDPEVHDALDKLLTDDCRAQIEVSVTPIKLCSNEIEPDGQSRIYSDLGVNQSKLPEVDRGGSNPAEYELTFVVGDMRFA